MKATLFSYVDIIPENVYINSFKGEEGKFSVSIKPAKYDKLKIKSIEIDNPKIKYTLDKPADKKAMKEKGYTLTIIAPPDLPPSNYNGIIKIKTDIKEQPDEEIRYNINVQDLITVKPTNIFLNVNNKIYKITALEDLQVFEKNSTDSPSIGVLNKDIEAFVINSDEKFAQIRFETNKNGYVLLEKTKKTYSGSQINISVQKHKGENFEVKNVECDLPFIRTEFKQVQPNYYLVTLTYDGEITNKRYNGKLIIYTNDGENPKIEKKVNVNVGIESPAMPPKPRAAPINRPIERKNPPQKLEEKK